MSFKGTYVLLALVVVGAVAWYLSGDGRGGDFTEETTEQAEPTAILADAPELDEVTGLTIQPRSGDPLVFTRTPAEPTPDGAVDAVPPRPGPWRMTAPVAAAAEQWVVSQMPRTLLELKSKRSFAPGGVEATRAEAGLETPQMTCTLIAGDRSYRFAIGRRVPVSNDTYVLVTDAAGGERVHVVEHDFKADIARRASDYRGKNLFDRDDGAPVHVEIVSGEATIALRKGAEGDWLLEQPVRAYADTKAAAGLVNQLQLLRVSEFIDDAPGDLQRYGLAEPEMVIRFETEPDDIGAGLTRGIEVGAYADLEKTTRFVRPLDSPWVASVRQDALDPLLPGLNALRDSRVMRVEAGRVERLELDYPERQPVVLTRVRGEWTGAGELGEIELSAVNDLVRALSELRAVDYVDEVEDPAAYGLGGDGAIIRVTPTAAVEPIELRIGAATPSGRNAYVQVSGQAGALVVASQKVEQLVVDPATLRSRKIFALRTDDIVAIRTTYKGRERVVVRDGDWQMKTPAGAGIDAGALRDILNDVALLRAAAVVGTGQPARYGLDLPPATLTITVRTDDDGTRGHALVLSEVGGQAYCMVDDLPYIFRLDRTVYRTLTGELIDHQVFDRAPADIEAVTLTDAAASLRFTRGEEGWGYAVDPYVRLDEEKVERLVEQLAGMQAVRYLAYTDGRVQDAGFGEPTASVILETGDGAVTLQLGPEIPGEGGRFSYWVEQARVFQSGPEGYANFSTSLDTFTLGEAEND